MALHANGTVTPNGAGANLYLPPKFILDSACPLTRGRDFFAVIVPNEVVVLAPTRTIDFPIHEQT